MYRMLREACHENGGRIAVLVFRKDVKGAVWCERCKGNGRNWSILT